jgi:ABC-type branched-subunit amino acid transport system substrate-binding protein
MGRTLTTLEPRSKKTRRNLVSGVLLVISLVLAACSSSAKSEAGAGAGSSDSGSAIKVMIIAPFTLAAAPQKASYDALRIQADLQNAKGGINGRKVDVIGCDDQSDPNVAAKCAQQAVSSHVVAILGMFSLVSSAIWPIITPAGIPAIGLTQYGAADMTAPNAWPLSAPSPISEAASTGYLAKNDGCPTVADVQANAGSDSDVPVALNKKVLAAAGAKYEGPFLLSVTNGLANIPANAKSVTSRAECANVSLGQNGIPLMKAILQINPQFKFATPQLGLPGTWAQQMGAQASSITTLGGLAPDTSSAPGIQDYLKYMKSRAKADTLNEFSKTAWASWYAFAQLVATLHGAITAQTLTTALDSATSVSTDGITAPVDFTKPTPTQGMTRIFGMQQIVVKGQNGEQLQSGTIDASTLLPS